MKKMENDFKPITSSFKGLSDLEKEIDDLNCTKPEDIMKSFNLIKDKKKKLEDDEKS